MHAADILGFRQIGHSDLGGFGDGMQLMRFGDALYVGHFGPSGMGTSVLDASDPTDLKLVTQWKAPAGGHNHKVQVADGLLLTNFEAFRGGSPDRVGMAVFDLSDPFAPAEIGFWNSGGKGVHRIVYEGGQYAYLSVTPDGFSDRIWAIVDVSDPTHPVEAGRWWWPGMAPDETRDWPGDEERSVHHAMVAGDRAYLGFWDSGMVILDISDYSNIRVVSHLNWEVGGNTHTCLPLPGRDIVVVTDEAVTNGCDDDPHMVRVVDISNETSPEVLSICPVPQGDFCDRGLRFGAHNLHENRPGSYRSAEVVFATYFNGGLRVYDLADSRSPAEIAHWVPECPPNQEACQINDVWVDTDLLVYITDRVNGGAYVLEPEPWLARRLTEAAM
ncbi:MAG: hypothetical protein OEX04_05870 [Acidimicrobiia bacterium]|nr:hypothetical protein [Acidimicrobiia bacterium]MDH4306987.1 hypothetical protein [Acidimicrobiia bacterium]